MVAATHVAAPMDVLRRPQTIHETDSTTYFIVKRERTDCMLYFRSAFAAMVSVVYLMYSPSGKALAATHEVSLKSITAIIERDGARATAANLYAHPVTWDAILKHIGTGEDGWIQLGIVLHGPSDAGAREMLEESFGEALERKPAVLLTLTSQGKLKTEEFCIGPDVDDERYSSYATTSRALLRRIMAVRAVDEDELRPYRESCLQALGVGGQHLHQFFNSSGE